jgi:hypothetical protein
MRQAEEHCSRCHCEEQSDEAIHWPPISVTYGLLRGACHRARIRATRWLAMTVLAAAVKRYLFDLRFFDVFRFFAPLFAGTFLPSTLASESPIAIACLRLLTLRPERPLLSVPALRFFIARPTLADAFLEYFRANEFSPGYGKIIFVTKVGSRLAVSSNDLAFYQAIAE